MNVNKESNETSSLNVQRETLSRISVSDSGRLARKYFQAEDYNSKIEN